MLKDKMTDLKMATTIKIGEVPRCATVEISLAIDASKSNQINHAISYQMLYGSGEEIRQIGQAIKLAFKLTETSLNNSTSTKEAMMKFGSIKKH